MSNVVKFYATNPCTTCAPNGILLAEAKKLGIEYEFHFVSMPNADVVNGARQGFTLPYFTDGSHYGKTAQDFLSASKPVRRRSSKTTQVKEETASEATTSSDTEE